MVKATKTETTERTAELDRCCDTAREDTASFLLTICTSASPDFPLIFAMAIEKKRCSDILPLCLSFQAITGLPRVLITFLNEAGLGSLIKMMAFYYILSQPKGHISLMALELCQISFDVLLDGKMTLPQIFNSSRSH